MKVKSPSHVWLCDPMDCSLSSSSVHGIFQARMLGEISNNLRYAEREVKWSEVTQSCPTLCDPMDCSLSGSSVHGIFQARVLEWIAISFSRGTSWPRNRTWVSHIAGRHFTVWATREAQFFIKFYAIISSNIFLPLYHSLFFLQMSILGHLMMFHMSSRR